MAEELNLGPDEAIVLRMENVGYGEGFPFPSDNNVLILTTRNIVLLKKNLFGQTSDTIKFPLSEIKVEQFLATLSDQDRQILELRLDGLTLEKIAKQTGCQNHSGVLKRLRRIGKAYEEWSGQDLGF